MLNPMRVARQFIIIEQSVHLTVAKSTQHTNIGFHLITAKVALSLVLLCRASRVR